MRDTNTKSGPYFVLASFALWGLLPIFWKQLTGVNALFILAERIIWAMLLCAVLLTVKKGWGEVWELVTDRKRLLFSMACGCVISVNWGSYIYAVTSGKVLEGSLAYYLCPILTILMGAALFREKLNKPQWASLVLAFAGLLIAFLCYGKIPWLALVMGSTFALYSGMKKKVAASCEVSIFMESLVVFLPSLLYVEWANLHGFGWAGNFTPIRLLLFPMAGVVTAVPLMIFSHGMQRTAMNLSGILSYISPTIQLLLGIFLYHEAFTSVSIISFSFTWAALILFVGSNLRRKPILEHSLIPPKMGIK